MLIALIIILIAVSLIYGFNHSDYFKFGINLIDFKYPFFHFGVSHQGYTIKDDVGDIFEVTSLNIGLVIITLFFSFYRQIGDKNTTTTNPNDHTVSSPDTSIFS